MKPETRGAGTGYHLTPHAANDHTHPSPVTNPMRLLAIVLVLTAINVSALNARQGDDEVMAVIHQLFDGMRAGDSAMVRALFHPDARMGRATPDGLRLSSPDGFIRAVGSPHDEVWDEPIWDWTVNIDGNLAQVWTKYAFFLGERFSHCGVDAFDLVRTADGWKIFQLVDTSQNEGCEMPPGR